MTDPNYWPTSTLKITANNNNNELTFVTDQEEAWLGTIGNDLLELARQLKAGQVEKTVDAIKDWIWNGETNGYRRKFIDWDKVSEANLPRVDGTADEQFHLDITKKGTVIIAYNKYGNPAIRYKLDTFKRIVNEAK